MQLPKHRRPLFVPMALGAALLAGCGASETSAGPEESVDVEDVAQAEQDSPYFDIDPLVGDEVTISGEVSEILSETAFRISGDEFGDEGVAVVMAGGVQLEEGAVAQVTGTVTERNADAVNEALDTDLADEDLADLTEEYVISANTVDVLVTASEGDAGPVGGVPGAVPSQLEQAGDFGILLDALSTAGLTDVLLSDGPYTVLAPTDDAFEALPEDQLAQLLDDPQRLTELLRSHVVEGDFPLDQLPSQDTLTTLSGATLDVTSGGSEFLVNGVRIVEQFDAANGVIHALEGVLMPPA